MTAPTTLTAKVALYGLPGELAEYILDGLAERDVHTVALVDDANSLRARALLSTKAGGLPEADDVARGVAGCDAVMAILDQEATVAGFTASYHAILALLEGLPTAGVKRLVLIGRFSWLDGLNPDNPQQLEHLQHSLHKSPLAWTLVDAPATPVDTTTLRRFAGNVVDVCLSGSSAGQRLSVVPRPPVKEAK